MRQRYFGDRLTDLPLILAGPILRQVNQHSVTVWVALTQAAEITLTVFQTEHGQGEQVACPQMRGQGYTVQIGKSLHLCAITAQGNEPLQATHIYAYDLEITGVSEAVLSLSRLSPDAYGVEGLSYFAHGLPTFATAAEDLEHLKLMHGSCRKPHGEGVDLLVVLDQSLQATANQALERIQQLFFTGDQIYGDDVADPLLWVATDVGDMLLGWTEKLAVSPECTEDSFTLAPGVRSQLAQEAAGLTASFGNSDAVDSSHLFSLGEYFATYLLVWSPFLWPSNFPSGSEVQNNIFSAKQWDHDVAQLKIFIGSLGLIRRALANVSVYMICDDHDVSDDWYLNRNWCERVLGKPLGYRVVMNGLLAYAFCQAWGNTPEQFFPGQVGAMLCEAVEQWSRSQGQDKNSEAAIASCLGLPQHQTELFQRDETVDILKRHPLALKWHYHVRGQNHEVIVLDTRTWRGYPDGSAIDPPMLLSPWAFQQQLECPLQEEKESSERLTFLVLPTNLVCLSLIDQIQQWDWQRDRVFRYDVGDSWNFNISAFTQLLLTLAQYRRRVIILSGDIHYSCAVKFQVWGKLHPSPEPRPPSVLVQFTCSAIKNAESASHVAHTQLKRLIPESSEDWLGWESPPEITERIYSEGRTYTQRYTTAKEGPYWHPTHSFCVGQGNAYLSWISQRASTPPNWRYCLQWTPRQTTQSTAFVAGRPRRRWHPLSLIAWSWRNRWMQEGPSVVGHNNVGVISLTRNTEDQCLHVIQECYWVEPWSQQQIVSSCYDISLSPLERPIEIG